MKQKWMTGKKDPVCSAPTTNLLKIYKTFYDHHHMEQNYFAAYSFLVPFVKYKFI